MRIEIIFYEKLPIEYKDGISINFVEQEDFLKIKRNNKVTTYFKLRDIRAVTCYEEE